MHERELPVLHVLYSVSVFLHIVAACTWIGAMIFFAVVVVPVVRMPEYDGVRAKLVRQVGGRFRRLGWGAIAVLAATGVTNLGLRGVGVEALASHAFWQNDFGHALAFKLVFVALVLLSTSAHDVFATRSRRLSAALGRATLLLSLSVVFFAVSLVRGLP